MLLPLTFNSRDLPNSDWEIWLSYVADIFSDRDCYARLFYWHTSDTIVPCTSNPSSSEESYYSSSMPSSNGTAAEPLAS